jgi:hypothetical protein
MAPSAISSHDVRPVVFVIIARLRMSDAGIEGLP